ncbi:hypothetical protein FSARC_8867 [Fusarium sarcochroum]|uniref:Uncharacterized protein n=1 Tax=Fusarium sarcochroum TaxID=1208366 RepID=A0A8H4X6N6_9HYPO|nr:hypothetical protein FSARC_8867 [Fusarium sarcochroum]
MPDTPPASQLMPPPEGILRTIDDLMGSAQSEAQETAEKRNPSTRKIDCPFRTKAIYEVQLRKRWLFTIQEGHHNHGSRTSADSHGQGKLPLTTPSRCFVNKLDHLQNDSSQGLMRVEECLSITQNQLQNLEAQVEDCALRLQVIEGRRMGGGEMEDAGSCLLASAVL